MDQIKPLTLDDFSDGAIAEAAKLLPEQMQGAIVGVATQIELQARRKDAEDG